MRFNEPRSGDAVRAQEMRFSELLRMQPLRRQGRGGSLEGHVTGAVRRYGRRSDYESWTRRRSWRPGNGHRCYFDFQDEAALWWAMGGHRSYYDFEEGAALWWPCH